MENEMSGATNLIEMVTCLAIVGMFCRNRANADFKYLYYNNIIELTSSAFPGFNQLTALNKKFNNEALWDKTLLNYGLTAMLMMTRFSSISTMSFIASTALAIIILELHSYLVDKKLENKIIRINNIVDINNVISVTMTRGTQAFRFDVTAIEARENSL